MIVQSFENNHFYAYTTLNFPDHHPVRPWPAITQQGRQSVSVLLCIDMAFGASILKRRISFDDNAILLTSLQGVIGLRQDDGEIAFGSWLRSDRWWMD